MNKYNQIKRAINVAYIKGLAVGLFSGLVIGAVVFMQYVVYHLTF